MNIIKTSAIAILFALCASQANAALQLIQPDANLTAISTHSISSRATNPGFIEMQAQNQAEKPQASHYYIHSISGENYLHANVTFYK